MREGLVKSLGFGAACLLVCLGSGRLPGAENVYLPWGASWRYFRGIVEASLPDTTAWRAPGFDDSSWAVAPAPFGYGEPDVVTDLEALDPPMKGTYTCLFLRTQLQVPRLQDVIRLEALVRHDDGFVLWINGIEVLRDNIDDPLAIDRTAPRARESRLPVGFDLPDPSTFLVEGTNHVALQVWNQSFTSTDFFIDIQLVDPFGPDRTPPAVETIVPAAGTTVRKLPRIEVIFGEDVVGVDAADLLIEGAPAQRVEGEGRGPYVFAFAQPPAGEVRVAWALDHGIVDVAPEPNAFAGGSWSYLLDPNAALPSLVISELLANNRSGLRDEDGEYSDWIEIENRGADVADLAGWGLTDDPREPGKWTFPSVPLAPGARVLVFASGKDRGDPAGKLHASFKLSSSGEYLGLYSFESPREVASEYAPRYPEQRGDISYGLAAGGARGYFAVPTPGEPNGPATSYAGIVAEPRFSPARGFYEEGLEVEIHCPTSGSTIRYTTDWTEPTQTSGSLYSAPIPVSGDPRKGVTVIRAVAFREGFLPSRTVTHSYIFPENVLTQPANPPGFPAQWGRVGKVTTGDYAMDSRVVNQNREGALEGFRSIPSISISLPVDDFLGQARGIYSNADLKDANPPLWERACSAEMIYPDGRKGFMVNCGIRVAGGTSTDLWKSYKLSLRLFFRGDYGPTKLDFPLFPDTRVTSFDSIILDAHLNQVWTHPNLDQQLRGQFVREAHVTDLMNAAGSLAHHNIMAHLFIDGLYWGLYDVHERPDASFFADHLGGEKEEYDILRHQSGNLVDGNAVAWNELLRRTRLGLASQAAYESLKEYLDVDEFADYMLVNFYTGNDDWPHHNWYAGRRRLDGEVWRFSSWDAEHVLKDAAYNATGVGTAGNHLGTPGEVYNSLRQNPEWRLLFADHVQRHMLNGCLYVNPQSTAWNEAAPENNVPAAAYMRRIGEIDSAIRLESARWGDNRRPTQPYTRDVEWTAELNRLLRSWFPQRWGIVLNQFRSAGLYPRLAAPSFSHRGGLVDPGLLLGMSLPDGTSGAIHYTTDGSDPRLPIANDPAPGAMTYVAPIPVLDTVRVKARTFDGTTWSALQEALFELSRPEDSLAIEEIMYHPKGGGEHEFIELHNAGAHTLDLSGFRFTNGIDFTFAPGAALGPGERFVLVADPIAFTERYPAVEIGGVYLGRLDNAGEKVTLRDAAGRTILSVDYGDEGFWPRGPDGLGHSLVVLDPFGDLDEPLNWRASSREGGSPGQVDPPGAHGGVVINEILPRPGAPLEDAVELHNESDRPVDVGGWFLGDDLGDELGLKKFRIPAGTVIPPGGHIVLYAYQLDPRPGVEPGLELPAAGGALYLASADAAGNLTGHVVGHEFDGVAEGVSLGRYFGSTGPDFVPLSAPTFGVEDPATVEAFRTGRGAANAEPLVGPVVINEIHYHPPEGDDEFVELRNVSGSDVDLGGWSLRGVLDEEGTDSYVFPAGSIVPAGGYLVVVGVQPGYFRLRYGVPDEAPIVGPYGGALDNAGEALRLLRPFDGPGATDTSILLERVRYNDRNAWPVEADGGGPSLERLRSGEYGNDPLNWAVSLSLGGTPGAANSVSDGGVNQRPIPAFDAVPQAQPLGVLLDASRSRDPDGTISAYRWSFGDGATGEGRTALHGYPASGAYTVRLTVVDGEGAESSASRVIVLGGPEAGGYQVAGDVDQDGLLNITDAVVLLGSLFLGSPDPIGCDPSAGPGEGANLLLLDTSGDGRLDISDVIYSLNYLFLGGPGPAQGEGCVRIAGCPSVCAP